MTIDNSVKYISEAVSSQSGKFSLSPSMSNTNTKRSKTLKNASPNNDEVFFTI